MKNIIVYINQFFGGFGGEDKAELEPQFIEGVYRESKPLPSIQYQNLTNYTVSHTIICGDNYISSNSDKAIETILDFLSDKKFDLFIAGPAFQAGRYGVACGSLAKAIQDKFGVLALTSMHQENPGVDMFKKEVIIFKGGHSAGSIRKDIPNLAKYAKKILNNEKLLSADEEGYFARGIRKQVFIDEAASDRAVDMLINKVNNQPFQTELPIPKIEKIPVAKPIKNLATATIALVTTSGVVPVGNPDKIQSASATRWGSYDVEKYDSLPNRNAKGFMTIHAGYDPSAGDEDPNILLPWDALKRYEKEGKIKKAFDRFYSTVGTGTTQKEAARMAQEIIEKLKQNHVNGVLMTST